MTDHHSRLTFDLKRRLRGLARIIFLYWPSRRRQRLELTELTPERLRDIGMRPEDARREGQRPFWD